ncbi:Permeases of the major facilitator superfamily [Desulfovibrio sp. DV]|nr:Permeases of the major facilitator superfamily [Desulfovibrio sp. DV]
MAWGALAVLAGFVLLALFPSSWTALIAGILLMDIGLQSAMVANQARIYDLDASARSRLNTVFMTIMFLGGALATAVSAQAFAAFGWAGVCAFGGGCAALALALELLGPKATAA